MYGLSICLTGQSPVKDLSYYERQQRRFQSWFLEAVCEDVAFIQHTNVAPTFENKSSSHQFGKLQTVEGEDIVEDDCPEVGSIEHTPDPA